MNQPVSFLTTEKTSTTLNEPDKFQYRAERQHRWLQKAALWVLRKLGCFAVTTTVSYQKKVLDIPTFMANICRQHAELCAFYQRNGDRLLLGPEEFSRLAETCFPERIPEFLFEGRYCLERPAPSLAGPNDYFGSCCAGVDILGLKVTVIPWMKGMLVIPKL